VGVAALPLLLTWTGYRMSVRPAQAQFATWRVTVNLTSAHALSS
jgi:hypothetical protein